MSLKIDYVLALTNLYGIVHKEKVIEIYNTQNKEQIEVSDIEGIMERNQEELKKQFTYVDGDYFVNEAIIAFDESDLYLEQKAGKPYYVPSKRQLLKYRDVEYFEKTNEYHRLFEFVKKYIRSDSVNNVEDICVDVVVHCQMDFPPSEIINDFNRIGISFDNQSQLSEALDLITDLANNTRLWVNNGYTPHELFEKYERNLLNRGDKENQNGGNHPIRKDEKVGRNEPCPCGSGKKYKKCCI